MSCYLILFQIFVGNLDSNVTDEHLRQVFSQYGELVHVKIPAGKRCGFVQFSDRLVFSEAFMLPSTFPTFGVRSLMSSVFCFLYYFRSCAEEALRILNGTQIGGQNIRLSWGRSPSNKQVVVYCFT